MTARLEARLRAELDPGAMVFSGERLREMTFGEDIYHEPGDQGASEYAARWAMAAPEEMHAWFVSQGIDGFLLPGAGGKYRFGYANQLFGAWTRKDPDAAIRAAESAGTADSQRKALVIVISTLLSTEPAKAAELTAKHAALLAEGNSTSEFHAPAAGDGYRKSWDLLRGLPEGKERGKLLSGYFDEVARYHKEEAATMWKEMTPETRQELVEAGFWGFGFRNYLEVEEENITLEGLDELWRNHVAANGDAKEVAMYLRNGAPDWAKTDPAAAIAWVRENLTGEAQVTGAAKLFHTGAAHQFDATVAAWRDLPEGTLRARAAGYLAAGAPEDRKAEAEALLSTLSPTDQNVARKAVEKKGR